MLALVAATAGLPRVVDACYRHRITPPEQFVMNPGHTTFSRVVRGQVIARDRDGPIAAQAG